MTDHTLAEFFQSGIEIEQKVADIYTAISRMFDHVPDVAAFWEKMAEDEREHVKAITEIRDSLSAEQMASPCSEEQWKSIERTKRYLGGDLTRDILNLDDAYELANEIEDHEVMIVFQVIAIELVPKPVRDELIALKIKEHLSRIDSFEKDFGGAVWRKTILKS